MGGGLPLFIFLLRKLPLAFWMRNVMNLLPTGCIAVTFFNFPKGSLLPLPLKLEATLISLLQVTSTPADPFLFFLCRDITRISVLTSSVPWLLVREMSIRYLELIWMFQVSNTWRIYCWYAGVFLCLLFLLLFLSHQVQEKEARLISRGFSLQTEKCSTDCSTVKEKQFSQFWNCLREVVNIITSQPAEVQWLFSGICRAESYLSDTEPHLKLIKIHCCEPNSSVVNIFL